MKIQLESFLSQWPSGIIVDRDIYCFFEQDSYKAQKDIVERAVKWGWLKRVSRGLYTIGRPFRSENPSLFELAQYLYGPSYISMESALSFHQLIPEAVYATVSVSAKRSTEFTTPLGSFLFHHIPVALFFHGVERKELGNSVCLVATPLKALGDYVYVNKKQYHSAQALMNDLRIEEESLMAQPVELLQSLAKSYPSRRVQQFYNMLYKELFK